ncbi:hypothetical protein [Planctobacterium marinum]|uniref:Uncharacterized protein n=1 Tax=Planctobacterium marinum TaxID=1631968 RepID=A0AA48KNK9_9ALTE|nr:hypothetical protein MACH26_11620 [Planctobacterium marinum]
MTKQELIEERLEQIRATIAAQNHTLAMLLPHCDGALHAMRMDDCDIGFMLLVEAGCKELFLRDIAWLAEIQHIAFEFRRSPGHFRFLFSDGIFCDLTVMEKHELESGIIPSEEIAWQRTTMHSEIFDVAVPQSSRFDLDDIVEYDDPDWLLGELLTNLLIGLRRFNNGEKLSAFYLIQHHALSRLLSLVNQWEPKQSNNNGSSMPYQQSVERNYPQLSHLLREFALGYESTPRSAMAILKYVEQHTSINYFIKDQILNQIQSHSNLH